ncbi:dymeclin [Phyllostomus discolor]|uniref:Dymeclin n=1 Tax=Phyllostomus discolor TaxID=89673 RepID=A0A834DNV8_9CHIR|nr:dymeclin [Phyllostomus discolor]
MGSNSSRIGDLPGNEHLKKFSGTESLSENDPFWNQLLSFSFPAPTSSADLKLLEEATVSVRRSLVENNPRTGNLGALIKVFLSRTKELKVSAECQNHIFIWQTHNALFIICYLLKVFICEMSEEELLLHFTYEEKSPGSYSSDSEDLLEELVCCLMQLITDIPLFLFSLLSKKHNKVLEQATQSLRGSLSSSDVPLPDYAQDLNVIEEVIRMMLEIINSCLTNSLHHNPNLVYALLYKRDLFEQFRTHPSFQDIMQNIDLVITFFSSRLLQAGAELSVERVLEIIKQGVVALPKDRLKKFPELKFKYVEEEQPEEFFIPYVWSLVYNSAVGLRWNPQDIQLFTVDSD